MAKTKKIKSINDNKKSIKNNNKTIKKSKKVKQLIIKKKLMTDEEIKDKESEYFSKKDFKHIIKRDLDVYYLKDGKKVLLAKFRKKVIPKKLCKLVIDNLKEAAKKEHDNRGPAAGPIDFKKVPQYVKKENVKEQGKYRIYGYYSDTTHKLVNNYIGNKAQSNIIGYFDRPDRNTNTINQPCRLTAFNANEPDRNQLQNGIQKRGNLCKRCDMVVHILCMCVLYIHRSWCEVCYVLHWVRYTFVKL